MKSRNKTFVVALFLVFLLCIITLGVIYKHDKTSIKNIYNSEKVNIQGKYILDGEDSFKELNKESNIQINDKGHITIIGHFSEDIPKNKMLIMRLDNLNINVFVNDEKVYSIMGDKNNNFSSSPGNGWFSFVSSGISKSDDIKIEISNVYTNHKNTVVNTFIHNLYCGYESDILLQNIRSNFWNLCMAIFTLCIGIIVLAFSCVLIKANKYIPILMCFGGMCIGAGIWFFIDFNIQNFLIDKPVFNNSLDIISMLFTMCLFSLYFSMHVSGLWNKLMKINAHSCAFVLIVSTVAQFLKVFDYYNWTSIIQLICIFDIILVFCGVTYEYYRVRNKVNRNFLVATYILLIGMITDGISNVLEIKASTTLFKISFFIFIVIQFIYLAKSIKRYVADNAKVSILQEMAYKDGLTGLNNKSSYLRKINEIDKNISKLKIRDLSLFVIVFDINYLKKTNDELGHEKGDELILLCSHLISKIFSNKNSYRIGGDEFTVIIERDNPENVNRKIKLFEDKCNIENDKTNINVSIACGMSCYNKNTDKRYSDIFVRADNAMYNKKEEMKTV